ncbi:MAG: ABC transporter permease, partial [Candidatus Alcyoniella australis]|nr:ABC transporter permease [Candidatus Alcyoniella australis]
MRYILRRLLLAVPTVLGVSTLVFFFVHMIPGDPVEVMLGETAQAVDKEQLRQQLGLDRPLGEQYVAFLGGLAHLDLGESFFYREPVLPQFDGLRLVNGGVVLTRFGPTLELALVSLLIALLIALPSGILAASRQGSVVDQASMTISLLGVSMPVFWMGPLLILAFSIWLPLFPPSGRGQPLSIVLPAVTLGVHLAAMLSRMTRSAVLEVIGEDYVIAARARGMPEWLVMLKHVMRNAAIPILTVIG